MANPIYYTHGYRGTLRWREMRELAYSMVGLHTKSKDGCMPSEALQNDPPQGEAIILHIQWASEDTGRDHPFGPAPCVEIYVDQHAHFSIRWPKDTAVYLQKNNQPAAS